MVQLLNQAPGGKLAGNQKLTNIRTGPELNWLAYDKRVGPIF